MMKHVILMLLTIVVAPLSVSAAGQTKIDICHIEGNGTYHVISIAAPAYDAHMAHGDMNVPTFYIDADGDGFGSSSTAVQACTSPAGYAENSADCDDTTAAVNPSASEVVDGIDNNCDGKVDDCAYIRLHCASSSSVLETVCGAGVHILGAVTAANISYVNLLGDTSSVVLHHCLDGSALSGQTLEIFADTNLCGLPGGCCSANRWNDRVCSVEIQ